MKPFILVILCIALLAGCTVPATTPVESTVTQGDFTLTIESAQTQYSLKKIFSTQPLNIQATFTYTGDEELTIWYAALIGLMHLKRGDQEIGEAMAMSLTTHTLKPGESIPITQDFTSELYQEDITVGEYLAVVYADFYLDEELTEKVYMEAEVPISITK